MAEQWFYIHEGKEMDPISAAELKQLAADGRLHPTDLVWKEGLPRWIPARNVKGLFPQGPDRAGAIREQADVPSPVERSLPEEDQEEERPRRRERIRDLLSDEDYDEEEERPRRRKKKKQRGLSPVAWVAIIGGICGFLLLGGIGAFFLLSWNFGGLPAEYSVNLKAKSLHARNFSFRAGVAVELTVRSDQGGDVDVRVYDSNNKIVALDETIGPNSKVIFRPPQTASYKVEVRNLGPGPNNSHVKIHELPQAQIPVVKVNPPVNPMPPGGPNNFNPNRPVVFQIQGTLNAKCAKDQIMRGYCNVHLYNMTAGRTYVIDLESDQFDAFLWLEDQGGKRLMRDDDSGGGLNARLTFTPVQDGVYRIIATSLGPNETGQYTLKIR